MVALTREPLGLLPLIGAGRLQDLMPLAVIFPVWNFSINMMGGSVGAKRLIGRMEICFIVGMKRVGPRVSIGTIGETSTGPRGLLMSDTGSEFITCKCGTTLKIIKQITSEGEVRTWFCRVCDLLEPLGEVVDTSNVTYRDWEE